MGDDQFPRLVSLACHDLRTPLATVTAATKMLVRHGQLGEREAQLAALADGAAEEMAALIDELALATRIAAGTYAPELRETDTLALVAATRADIAVHGDGTTVSTAVEPVQSALAKLAAAALRHGDGAAVSWSVAGRSLTLAPLSPRSRGVLAGASDHELGVLAARLVLEALGARLSLTEEALRVELA